MGEGEGEAIAVVAGVFAACPVARAETETRAFKLGLDCALCKAPPFTAAPEYETRVPVLSEA
jgi:hypothetical protein